MHFIAFTTAKLCNDIAFTKYLAQKFFLWVACKALIISMIDGVINANFSSC